MALYFMLDINLEFFSAVTLDMQDLLGLEEKKAELEKHLGHTATEQEWANHVGVSVLHLYAR